MLNSYRKSDLSRSNQLVRLVWSTIYLFLISWIPRGLFFGWIRFWLCLFGAKIDKTARVYAGVKIYYPANLIMEQYSSLAPGVDCYNVDKITVGAYATVSQNTTLCTASHDIADLSRPLIVAPITIGKYAWVAAEAFIGMGTTVGEYSVVGARSVVVKDVEPWTVVAGHPAKLLKTRTLKEVK